VHLAGAGDRDVLVDDAAGQRRLERARAGEAKTLRLEVVDAHAGAARRRDPQLGRFDPGGGELDRPRQVDRLDLPERHRDPGRHASRAPAADDRVPPAPRGAAADLERVAGRPDAHERLPAGARLHGDAFARAGDQRDVRAAVDVEAPERIDRSVFGHEIAADASTATIQCEPGKPGGDDDAEHDKDGERGAAHGYLGRTTPVGCGGVAHWIAGK